MRTLKKLLQLIVLALPISVLTMTMAVPQAAALVSNPAPAAKVTFTFDDGLESALTQAAPALATYGLSGTNYVITGCVGMTTAPNTCAANTDGRYMSWAQLTQLKSTYGWEIASHSVNHPELATSNLTDAQLTAEIAGSKQALADQGFNATAIASPYGDYDNRTLAEIAKYYESHRGFADVDNNIWSYNDILLNNMQVQAGVTVAQVQARIDDAIANNYWLVLTFHDIKTNPSVNPEDYEYKTSDLAAIAAYVKTKQDAGALKSVNVSQGLVKSDTNLLTNGSFAAGLTGGWNTTTGTSVTVDAANHGSAPEAQHAASFATSANNSFLFSPKVTVDATQTYMVKSYLNLLTRTAGELGFYIDEYDAAGNWISGQWKLAKTTVAPQYVNFTYKPTNSSVKKASAQVYTTANSGITAYVDNFQMFSLQDTTTPPPASTNLLPNSNFDGGIASGWSTNNAAAFAADNGNHGSTETPVNSVKLTAGAANSSLFAPHVVVQPLSTYTVNAYVNMLTRTNEELAFYIDEYDAAGNWISGQYAFAKRAVGAETISFDYTPSSANVHKAGLQLILVGGSGITGYVDDITFLAPEGETPTPPTPPTPPTTPTNLIKGDFETGLAEGWTTNDPINIKANNGNHGGTNNPVNSIELLASTQNRHLFSPQVAVTNANAYNITTYVNVDQITSGEVGFYIDEYDAAGNWISGQYKTGVSAVSAGDVTFSYTPSSAAVAKASLQVIVVGNSGIHAYVDDIRWLQQ